MGTRAAASLPATKLVCTLGPASDGRIAALVAAGMSVARLNFAHGTLDDHAARLAAVRSAARDAGREVGVLADLPGPKVRMGALVDGAAELEAGSRLTLLAGLDSLDGAGNAARVATNHAGLAGDLRAGDHVHLSDGAVELVVLRSAGREVVTVVERGGTVRSGAGVNLPAERLSLPVISERDRDLARAAADLGVDAVGQSFVRGAADVEELRAILGPGGPGIVAKIETRPAVDDFAAIAAAADGVMIARGDLGLELPFEEVPLVQKRLVDAAVALGRPVIVATQMLESMVGAPRPTRAEASDIANAVLDGADAVMLSGETAIGRFPVLAAEAAIRICRAAEAGGQAFGGSTAVAGAPEGAVAVAAVALAGADPAVHALVVCGAGAPAVMAVAARRPRVPVVAVVPEAGVARWLALVRGVVPVVPAGRAPAPSGCEGRTGDLLGDPAVRAVLPAEGRVVLLAGVRSATPDRIEVLDLAGTAR